MKLLHFDCFSGISGDMTIAALTDLGVPRARLVSELRKLGLSSEYRLAFSRALRGGVRGMRFQAHLPRATPRRAHAHGRHAHGRSFAEIRRRIERSRLSPFVRRRAVNVFRRIAEAEGKIHAQPTAHVHFHEIGAIDSIVDIVGVCVLLEALAPDRITASTPCEGKGFVECAHGRFPVPTAATLEILKGITIRQIDLESELITPTGAAILAEFVEEFGRMPEMAVDRIGYGCGQREHPSQPNVLRVVLGQTNAAARAEEDEVVVLETNVDDATPEVLAATAERLLASGARDAFLTPLLMKKGRPGVLFTVLADPERAKETAEALFRETGTFGIRVRPSARFCLDRETRAARTPWGPVAIKTGARAGRLLVAKPEFADCDRLARKTGRPVRDIWAAATAECARLLLSSAKKRRPSKPSRAR